MFLRRLTLLLLALLWFTSAAPHPTLAADPAQEYLDDYQRAVDIYFSKQRQDIESLTKPAPPRDPDELEVFRKRITVRIKSSSLTRAFRLAKKDMSAAIKEWIDEIVSEGYILVNKPQPIIDFDPKHGMKGFHYYVRLKVYLKLWAQKSQ